MYGPRGDLIENFEQDNLANNGAPNTTDRTIKVMNENTGDYVDGPNPNYIDPNAKPTADNISEGYADIIRADYDDWETRGLPFEQAQQDMLLDPTKKAQMRSNALGYVDQSVGSAVGQTKANMHANDRRLGRQLGADESKARERRLGNQEALSLSSGRTKMRQNINDREVNMLAGGIR